jgi:hypothetical protein
MAARSLALLVPLVLLTSCNTWESVPVDGGNSNKDAMAVEGGVADGAGDDGTSPAIDAGSDADAADASGDAPSADSDASSTDGPTDAAAD